MHFVQIVVTLILFTIIYCLASSLFFLLRDGGTKSTRVVKALTWRIVISVCLFIFLIVAYFLGWIHPHGVIQ